MTEIKKRDLVRDRLATTDEFGRRIFLHPADVKGIWRNRRTLFQGVLTVFFLILPWVRWNSEQAVLLDIFDGRLALFGLRFWAHDAPILVLVALVFVFGLLFFTAVFGRVWCGWACPQTVFIEFVFRRIERFVEGDGFTRRKLEKASWDADKLAKRLFKWALYLVAALVVSHSVMAYLVGIDRLAVMVRTLPSQNWTAFGLMIAVTAAVLFNFGWFREQFCIIACPYGRMQSVLMDAGSLAVAYDISRTTDCVNCYRCVQVCPTGIDIRRGLQMECVACTACIDACDIVMTKVKKPLGLIRYLRIEKVSQRAYVMGFLWILALGALGSMLVTRRSISATVVRASGAPYQLIDQGLVLNHLRIHVSNQSFQSRRVLIRSADPLVQVVTAVSPSEVPAGKTLLVDVFVKVPRAAFVQGSKKVSLQIEEEVSAGKSHYVQEEQVGLVGPMEN